MNQIPLMFVMLQFYIESLNDITCGKSERLILSVKNDSETKALKKKQNCLRVKGTQQVKLIIKQK